MDELLKKLGIDGKIEEHPGRPSFAKEALSTSVTAYVDIKNQILRPIRPFAQMVNSIPSGLSHYAAHTLLGLFDVFKKHGFVKEGIAEDILWGFQQCGYDPKEVAYGLIDLKREGYIEFIAPDGNHVDEHCTQLKDCWVKYTDKILNLVYSG